MTASALPEAIDETPVAATVITRNQLETRQVADVVDALREVPGVAVSRTGSQGKTTTIFIRGGSSKQALVLWNGVQMNNPYFSGYDFGQLSSAGVEKVEVVRGPFSALYGSEAVSGVVNVLTRPTRPFLTVEAQAGEKGLLRGTATGAWLTDSMDANLAVEHRVDDGFFANDDFEASSASAGATWKNDRTSLGVAARYTTYDLGVPLSPDPTFTSFVPSLLRRQDGSESQISLPFRHLAGAIQFEVIGSQSRREEAFTDPQGAFGPVDDFVESVVNTGRASAQSETSFGVVTVGGEWSRAVVDLVSGLGNIDSRDRVNNSFFIEDRLSRNLASGASLEVAAGARYDSFESFGSETSPRIAVAWIHSGNKFRAAYGEGFRAPAIGELYFPFGGNASLGAERSDNIEAGYERFGTAGSLSITVFRSNFENLIAFGSLGTFENVAAATSRGVELGMARTAGPLRVDASYTWLDAQDEQTGQDLIRRPRHSGSLALAYRTGAWLSQLVATYRGSRLDVFEVAPFGIGTNPSYTTLDLTVHYEGGAFRPFVKAENLSNEVYEEVLGYPSARRRIIAGIRYNFR